MADDKRPQNRSPAAQEASRRNGAKSRGPRTAAGKATSARNAVRHGLRARQAVRPENLPDWITAIEASLVNALGSVGPERREQLDRLLSVLVLIDRADRLITEALAHWLTKTGARENFVSDAGSGSLAEEIDVSAVRKLVGYRRRFRAERDLAIKRIVAPVPATVTMAK